MNEPEAPSFEEFSLKFLCTTGKSHFPVRFRTGRRSPRTRDEKLRKLADKTLKEKFEK